MRLLFAYLLQFLFFFLTLFICCPVESHPINEGLISTHYAYPINVIHYLQNFGNRRLHNSVCLANVVFW